MYTQHFHLTELPFSIAPNPRYLYLSPQHREALAHLLYGIGVGGGFVVLTGEVGTGKTTLCRALLEQLPEDVDIALIFNPRLNSRELLAGICDELHIPYSGPRASLKQLIDALNRHLLDAHARGRRVIVLIDEAQNLRFDVLEQVRLLTNLETNQAKLLQIILVGQPELNQILDRPQLRQLAQRITARYHLDPLSRVETGDYIRHRLAVAGSTDRLFSMTAIRAIHRQAHGIPRLINLMADRALLGAYTLGKPEVSAPVARRAGRELAATPPSNPLRGWVAALMLTGGILGMAVHQGWIPGHWSGLPAIKPEMGSESAARTQGGEERKTGADLDAATGSQPHPAAGPPMLTAPPATAFPDWIGRPECQRGGALTRLLGLWSLTPPAGMADPCAWASTRGLRCQPLQESWPRLLGLNLPAVLEFVTTGGEHRFAALIRIQDRQLELANGGQSARFERGDVLSLWNGKAITIWKPSTPDALPLRPGATAPGIGQIRQLLGFAALPGAENLYDPGLQTRVVEFQQSHGLKADGIIGAMTLLYLQAVSPEPGTPRLTAASP